MLFTAAYARIASPFTSQQKGWDCRHMLQHPAELRPSRLHSTLSRANSPALDCTILMSDVNIMWLYLNKTVQRTRTTYENPGLKHKLMFPSFSLHLSYESWHLPASTLSAHSQTGKIEKDVDLVQKELTSIISSAGISIRNSHRKKESSYNFNKFHSSTHGFFLHYTVLTTIKSQVTVLSPPNKNFLRYLPELKVGL